MHKDCVLAGAQHNDTGVAGETLDQAGVVGDGDDHDSVFTAEGVYGVYGAVGTDADVEPLVRDRDVEQALLGDVVVHFAAVYTEAGETGPVGKVNSDASDVAELARRLADVVRKDVSWCQVARALCAIERGEMQAADVLVVGREPRTCERTRAPRAARGALRAREEKYGESEGHPAG